MMASHEQDTSLQHSRLVALSRMIKRHKGCKSKVATALLEDTIYGNTQGQDQYAFFLLSGTLRG
jgi:hypothetical protein